MLWVVLCCATRCRSNGACVARCVRVLRCKQTNSLLIDASGENCVFVCGGVFVSQCDLWLAFTLFLSQSDYGVSTTLAE